MGQKVSAAQAALLVGRNERIIRRDIERGKLPATQEGKWLPWLIDTDDLERVYGKPITLDPTPAEQITALTQRVERLEGQVQALERRLRESPQAPRDPPPARIAAPPLPSVTTAPPRGIPAPPGVTRRLNKAYAGKLIARHGANPKVAADWPWPPEVLVSDRAILTWGIAYVQAGDWRRKGKNWVDQCSYPDCPCHQTSDR